MRQRKLTLLALCRDFLVYVLPRQIIPRWLIRLLYGNKVDFIFLVHPRHKKDIYNTLPILKFVSQIIPEKFLLFLFSLCPAYMVSKVNWPLRNIRGLVISTSIMPEDLFSRREDTSLELKRIIKFIRKIKCAEVYVGLAAWWPIVTNGGLAFKKLLSRDDCIFFTNGHTATLLSIYLMVHKICSVTGMNLKKTRILVIGIGKMGSAVAEILNGKVNCIGMIDRNSMRIKALEDNLLKASGHSDFKKYSATDSFLSEHLTPLLSEYDIAICTTSSLNYIVSDKSVLKNCIIIDDSRPEAFPRIINYDHNSVVLEGGIIRFRGLEMDADFGFGRHDNVFGCMAEAIILASDKDHTLNSTVGEIDYDNFRKMLDYCKSNDITEGDFKSGQNIVAEDILCKIVNSRRSSTASSKR